MNPPSVPPSDGLFLDPDEPVVDVPPPVVPLKRRGLIERQVTCPDGGTTAVSGTVYIPSGALPLYNAMVYVPDAELAPLTPGASCICEVTGAPLVSALTDAAGRFVLENVPVGENIPLVIQVGDWRREFNIGTVNACAENPVPDQTLRLPTRQAEGDLPNIAISTGQLDALECLIRKLGIDPSEFTAPGGGGRVQMYAGQRGTDAFAEDFGGQPFPPADELWSDLETLSQYDIVMLSCGGRDDGDDKPEAAYQAMFDYVNQGGRMFASHYQSIWFQRGPAPFPDLAEFVDDGNLGELSAQVVTSFPKGEALSQWLVNTATTEEPGEVEIRGATHNIASENPEYAQRWIATEDPASVQYISANTPLGVSEEDQCGRVVLSDIHVSPGEPLIDDFSDLTITFPEGCITSGLTPQERVLAFMFFDISACVVPDSRPPVPPTIIR